MAHTRPSVRIVEVGPRDGLQNIDKVIPTDLKVELIRRLASTGLSVIEATSFVSPKWIPQLADGADVMKAIKPLIDQDSIRYSVLVPNLKGLEGAAKSGAKEVGVFVSATEGFSQKNTNCSVAEALDRAKKVAEKAVSLGIQVRGYVSCIFADPYDGPTAPSQVTKVSKALLDVGCFEISLGDTLGVGTPAQVKALLDDVLKVIPVSKVAGHFHDTYGTALANAVTAYNLGLRTFDSSVSGLGGCPYSPGAKGNVASEDLVYTFEKMGVSTGVDLGKLVEIGDWIAQRIGQENGSRAGAAIMSKLRGTQKPSPRDAAQKQKPQRHWSLIEDTGEYQVLRSGANVKIVLTRAKNGNALTANMLKKLAEVFETLAKDKTVYHIILTAQGKFFCTGMDLSAGGATNAGTTSQTKETQFHGLLRLFEAIDNAPQTTISLINGSCFGGGTGLAFACDIRLAKADVRFTLTEVKLGLTPATISKYVSREWGVSYTREAMLTARPVTATELHDRLGAIHGIAKDDKGLEELLDVYMERLRRTAPTASAKTKDLIRAAYRDPGGPDQAKTIRGVYDWMMDSDEAKYGSEQFRAGNRNVDWEAVGTGSKSKL